MVAPIHRVIIGTAGHIDHGKSSLVRRLTGIDPDRLKEEKDRGMTIDLGFARYETSAGQMVGIIDVPGHERFIKNMVAGASSVDLFILVVAADDGIMPQTREHVDILDLLGARRGIVAVNKIDLVDPELRELAVAEIEEYLQGTPFEGAPMIPVSATTGEGFDELKATLDTMIGETEATATEGLFRMPIQRVFSARGHGTVVTGVPISGRVQIGEMVEVLPIGKKGKVRSIQAYQEERDGASAGHSTALNLSDLDYREVSRGMVVATPGYFRPTQFLEARLRYLASAEKPLKHGSDVRVHLGTHEELARTILLEGSELAPGGEALVQLRLRSPVVAMRGDRFLIRLPTPMITLGGGVIVSESEHRITRTRETVVEGVRTKADAVDRVDDFLEQTLRERGSRPTLRREVAIIVKRPIEEAAVLTNELIERGAIRDLGHDRVLHREAFEEATARLEAALKDFHERNPLRSHVSSLELRKGLKYDEVLLDAAIRGLVEHGRVVAEKGGRVRLKEASPRLTLKQREVRDSILHQLQVGGLAPPRPDELVVGGASSNEVTALLQLMVDAGELVRTSDIYFSTSALDRAAEVVREVAGRNGGEVVVPEVRDGLDTSRKFLIPILEHLDSRGITARRGDKRYLVETRG